MSASLRPRSVAAPTLGALQSPILDRLEQVTQELHRIVMADFPLISAVNAHLMLMKGKMFRPTLVLLCSMAEDRAEPRAITLAAVIELVHLATLVHDDSVDHSALRRGMPTVNSLFSHQVSVIMGDFLYSRAVVELVRLGDLEVLRVLADATNAMTVGEMRQLTSVDALTFSEQDYEGLIRAKTASLLSAACEIGALAGAAKYRRELATYGERLGMAFQVADDLLDYTSQESATGKPCGLDLREHKVTLPLIAALRVMPSSARQHVEVLFSEPEPSDKLIARVIEIVAENGGFEYARRRGQEYARAAEQALASLPGTSAVASLRDAIAYATDRSQ